MRSKAHNASDDAHPLAASERLRHRRRRSLQFQRLCALLTSVALFFLLVLLFELTRRSLGWLDWDFLVGLPSRHADRAGIRSALAGSIWLVGLTALIAVPLGVGAALYFEEYVGPSRLRVAAQMMIGTLAGVPSILYGVLGLVIFVRTLHLGRSILAGALTLSALSLPVIVIAAREAIRAVPKARREAAFALGASRWRVVRDQVLPGAASGIVTALLLALSRVLGATAPLIVLGALTYVAFVPAGPLDAFTALPIQIFNWASRPQEEFHDLASAAIVVLLILLFLLNGVAVAIRRRAESR